MKALKLLTNRTNFSFLSSNLLGQQSLVNVRQNTTISNSHMSQQFAQFFIVPHSKLKVPWYNPCLLVIPCSITSQFQNLNTQKLTLMINKHIFKFKITFGDKTYLSAEVFKNGGEVNRGTRSNTLRITTCFEEASNAANGELETGFA